MSIDPRNENNNFTISHIFDDNINRVWYCLRNVNITSIVEPSLLSQVSLLKGINFYTEGSEFKSYWVGVSYINGKCTHVDNEEHFKSITWELDFDIQIRVRKTFSLFEVTNNNSTLVVLKVEMISIDQCGCDYQPAFHDHFQCYIDLYEDLLFKIHQYMKVNPIYLTNEESCVVKINIVPLWNFITDLNKVTAISKLIAEKFIYKGDPYKIGTFIKGISSDKTILPIFLKRKNVEKDPDSSSWYYTLETFGTTINSIRQEIIINCKRINSDSTQLTYTHNFFDVVSKEMLKEFARQKRKFLKEIKTYCTIEDQVYKYMCTK